MHRMELFTIPFYISSWPHTTPWHWACCRLFRLAFSLNYSYISHWYVYSIPGLFLLGWSGAIPLSHAIHTQNNIPLASRICGIMVTATYFIFYVIKLAACAKGKFHHFIAIFLKSQHVGWVACPPCLLSFGSQTKSVLELACLTYHYLHNNNIHRWKKCLYIQNYTK